MNFSSLFVLVIEPSNLQRSIIVNHLRSYGIEHIDEYTEGQKALEAMQHQTPDMVVSSMHLPDMTGTDVVTQMRNDETLESITFLLISSETHYRYLEPIRQSGAIAILPKPFTREDLGRALQSTLHYIIETDEETEHSCTDFEHLHVLLVDDSRTSRRYLHQVLSSIGIQQIVEAEDGQQALNILQSETFDLIISDYNMPNVDGKEMVEHIRSHDNQTTIPIMMVTSEQNKNQLAGIQNAGVSALCAKPLSYDVMKHVITQLLFEQEL